MAAFVRENSKGGSTLTLHALTATIVIPYILLRTPETHIDRPAQPTTGVAVGDTGQAQLIQSHSSARFSFDLSGNSNYIIHCNSNYVQNFELEISSI